MKLNFEGIKLSVTEEQIEELCNKIESSLKQKHSKRWNDILNESIKEKAALAGRTSDERTEDDICHGMAYVLPEIFKDYTKLFIKQALTEIFCDKI